MEPIFQAHPIPQNVTNFEFHLVGDMTLKQFAYLAAGVGFAFLIFTTLSTVQPLIAWPIIVISALLGVAFAFLPIQERPLDHWVAAFFKAIFQPTLLKFSSKIIQAEDPLFSKRLGHYLRTYKYVQAKQHAVLGNPNLLPTAMSAPVQPGTSAPPNAQSAKATSAPIQSAPIQKKQNFIDKFKAGQTSFSPPVVQGIQKKEEGREKTVSPNQTPPNPQPQTTLNSSTPLAVPAAATELPTPGLVDYPKVISQLPDLNLQKPTVPQKPVQQPPPQAVIPAAEPNQPGIIPQKDLKKTIDLAEEAYKTQQEIAKIETSLSRIKQLSAQPGVDPKTYIEEFEDLLTQLQKLNEKASKTAKDLAEISKEPPQPIAAPPVIVKAKSIPTLKLTSFPNVISGIVTDSLGNYLEGAIVVAHDKQGLPVRALKSNKLGQFVAATPLPNGDYSIVVEKDNLGFDKVAIELKNEVLPPILIEAKKLSQGTA